MLKMDIKEDDCKEKQTTGKIKQFLATLCTGPVTLGASVAWTSPVLPQFQNVNSTATLHLSIDEGSWVGAMLPIGALICAIPAGYLADRFGSKKCLIGFTVPTLLFALLIVFTNNVYTFCVARALSGFTTGGISVAGPMYISEISEVSLRGTLSSLFELMIYVGVTLTALFGAYVDYQILTSLIALFTLLMGFVFFFLPESPTYLMKVKKRSRAERALKFYRTKNFNAAEVLDEINDAIVMRSQLKSGTGGTNVWQLLKSKAVVRGLVASVGLTSFQQLSAVDGIVFYTVQIFERADSVINAYTCSIIMAVVELVAAMFLITIVEKADRKTFLYISSVGTGVCLASFAIYFTLKEFDVDFYGLSVLPLASMFTYNVAFALGLGPIPWMINGELFAPEIKGVANGITIATTWTLLFTVTKTMPIMMLEWGAHYTFYLYASFMAVTVVFVRFCVPETRGKTLEQIQVELNS